MWSSKYKTKQAYFLFVIQLTYYRTGRKIKKYGTMHWFIVTQCIRTMSSSCIAYAECLLFVLLWISSCMTKAFFSMGYDCRYSQGNVVYSRIRLLKSTHQGRRHMFIIHDLSFGSFEKNFGVGVIVVGRLETSKRNTMIKVMGRRRVCLDIDSQVQTCTHIIMCFWFIELISNNLTNLTEKLSRFLLCHKLSFYKISSTLFQLTVHNCKSCSFITVHGQS